MTQPPPGAHTFDVVSSELVYQGAILALRIDDVVMPDGRVAKREVVEHHGAVAIAAVDAEDRLTLVRQYRHPVATRLLELPAGLLDLPGEDPLAAAERELLEEAGLVAERWSVLVDVALSPGFTDEGLRIYFAEGLSQGDRPDPEHEEADIELVHMSVDEAVRATLAGEIVNATAVAGILALAAARAGSIELRGSDAPWPGRPVVFAERKAASRHAGER